MKYKITVQVEKETDDKYPSHDTIYEQMVGGDETIVDEIVRTVLNYNTEQRLNPNDTNKQGRKEA